MTKTEAVFAKLGMMIAEEFVDALREESTKRLLQDRSVTSQVRRHSTPKTRSAGAGK